MTPLEQIADALPNGFHDTLVRSCEIDFVGRSVRFEIEIWVGDDRDFQAYRRARLTISGLAFCAFDPPDPRSPFDEGPLRIDLCESDRSIEVLGALKHHVFSGRFWGEHWNRVIHIAGEQAHLDWLEPEACGSARADTMRREHGFFLNVDLEVAAREDLAPLVEALEPSTYVLDRPEGQVAFGLDEPATRRPTP